jgi:metallophosphoesterase superfamily enzyme
VAKVRVETRLVRRRCFAIDGERMIMPAFGAYAGGLNILDEAYDGMFRRGLSILMLGAAGVYRFEEDALLPDTGARRRRFG